MVGRLTSVGAVQCQSDCPGLTAYRNTHQPLIFTFTKGMFFMTGEVFTGQITDVLVFNRALSDEEARILALGKPSNRFNSLCHEGTVSDDATDYVINT